jgi:anti-anti-sigma factor
MPILRALSVADAPVFAVHGSLDVTTAADLRAEMTALLASGPRTDLIVELAGVEQVDMVGLGLLVGLHRQAQRTGRRLVLSEVPPRVMRLLVATRLHRVLAIKGTPTQSLGSRVVTLPDTEVRAG